MTKASILRRAEHGGHPCVDPQDDLGGAAGPPPHSRPDRPFALRREPLRDIRGRALEFRAARGARGSRRTPVPEERAAPSFSSLSDALKAAAPLPEQRRTLEEKIADMLENGEAPAASCAAVGVPCRLCCQSAVARARARCERPRPIPAQSGPGEVNARSVPAHGLLRRNRRDARLRDAAGSKAGVIAIRGAPQRSCAPPRGDAPVRPATAPVSPKVGGPASIADLKKADFAADLRLPSGLLRCRRGMDPPPAPRRLGNERTNVSGLRPLTGTHAYRPGLREADEVSGPSPEAEPETRRHGEISRAIEREILRRHSGQAQRRAFGATE